MSNMGDHAALHSMERVGGESRAHVRIMAVSVGQEAGHTSHEIEFMLPECERKAACKGDSREQKWWPSMYASAARAPQARAAASSIHEIACPHEVASPQAPAASALLSQDRSISAFPLSKMRSNRERVLMPLCTFPSVCEDKEGGKGGIMGCLST